MARIRQSVAAMANDVDRTSANIDVLIQETRRLVAAVHELVGEIRKHGIDVNPTIGDTEIPIGANISVNEKEK